MPLVCEKNAMVRACEDRTTISFAEPTVDVDEIVSITFDPRVVLGKSEGEIIRLAVDSLRAAISTETP